MLQNRLLYFPEKTTVAAVVSQRLSAWPTPYEFQGLVAEPAGAIRGSASCPDRRGDGLRAL